MLLGVSWADTYALKGGYLVSNRPPGDSASLMQARSFRCLRYTVNETWLLCEYSNGLNELRRDACSPTQ